MAVHNPALAHVVAGPFSSLNQNSAMVPHRRSINARIVARLAGDTLVNDFRGALTVLTLLEHPLNVFPSRLEVALNREAGRSGDNLGGPRTVAGGLVRRGRRRLGDVRREQIR